MTCPIEPHKHYERRLALWLGVAYTLIALVSAALVIYAAVGVGWRPGG
jgi:hypothetical protein